MAYASVSDMLARYDARTLGDLVGDTNNRLTPTQLATDPNIAAALSTASGQVNSAALFSERYTVAELTALTGDDKAFLIGLVCDLAFGKLNLRRGNDPEKLPSYMEAKELLEMLRQGNNIFNVPGIQGVNYQEFPSAVTYQTVNMLRDACLNRFFPVRRYQNTASGGQGTPTN